MDQITTEQIQETYSKLPKEVQAAISSPDIHAKIQRIGRDQGLMLDQVGMLVDQVGLVMLGLAKSSSFVKETAKRLGIDEANAKSLAIALNDEVLGAVRNKIEMSSEQTQAALEKESQDKEAHVAEVEKAGGFTIDRQPEAPKATDLAGTSQNLLEERSDMIAGIENPTPVVMKPRTEPLVDQLLRGSTAISEQKISIQTPKSAAPSVAKPDPYKEPI